jgi:protein-L-isoaspartate(D-aspartate) O-methyltransferase
MERDALLREAMVSQLERTGLLRDASVAAALRTVPRHRFLPGTPLDEAYADRAIAIKMKDGEIVSSISQPGMIVLMLELLAPASGDRILEIGTGSGFNAALLAELVGAGGSVTTTDLDADLAACARATLDELGYRNVRVLAADGGREIVHETQFDRLVVTARSDDVAAAWWDELSEGARLVVPLRLEGAGEYAVGFVRHDDRLQSVGVHPCAFIALRGEAAVSSVSDLFYRDPAQRSSFARLRRVADVVAVPREHATPALLDQADLVIARPVTVFAVRFVS